ncbi:hypothetical protein C8J57DRAFT_1387479 [Mycena rebaudengoi]|nr:hypothetical protein C8J57DRAFT_1387479 [Mycena rebaudengoi]
MSRGKFNLSLISAKLTHSVFHVRHQKSVANGASQNDRSISPFLSSLSCSRMASEGIIGTPPGSVSRNEWICGTPPDWEPLLSCGREVPSCETSRRATSPCTTASYSCTTSVSSYFDGLRQFHRPTSPRWIFVRFGRNSRDDKRRMISVRGPGARWRRSA